MNNELNNDAALSKYDAAFDIFNVGHLWLEKYLFVIIFTIRAKNTIRFRWNGPGISLQKSSRALILSSGNSQNCIAIRHKREVRIFFAQRRKAQEN